MTKKLTEFQKGQKDTLKKLHSWGAIVYFIGKEEDKPWWDFLDSLNYRARLTKAIKEEISRIGYMQVARNKYIGIIKIDLDKENTKWKKRKNSTE